MNRIQFDDEFDRALQHRAADVPGRAIGGIDESGEVSCGGVMRCMPQHDDDGGGTTTTGH